MVRNRWYRYTSIDNLLVIQNIDFLPYLHIRNSSWHDSVIKSFVNIAYWVKSTGGKESVLSLCINELSSRNTKMVFFYRTYISQIVHGMTVWLMTVLFTILILSGSRTIRFTELWCYQGPSRWHSTARNWIKLWHYTNQWTKRTTPNQLHEFNSKVSCVGFQYNPHNGCIWCRYMCLFTRYIGCRCRLLQ